MHALETIVLLKVKEDDLEDVPAVGRRLAIEGASFKAVPNGGDHANVLKYRQWERAVQGYLAACSFVDAQVGRTLAAREASAYAENTVIVLWMKSGRNCLAGFRRTTPSLSQSR